MPVGFGPSISPRQRVDGKPWANPMAHLEIATVSFLTEERALKPLLPPGIELAGEPVVTVEVTRISELEWLAGRGYNTVGVRFPARFRGKTREVTGPFLAILWENKADPIITGREELGFAKLYCEIPPERVLNGQRCHEASWEGHRFMDMTVGDLVSAEAQASPTDGTLHYRYVPAVGTPGKCEGQGVVITPPSPMVELLGHARGRGNVRFHESTWEQLPTLFHIVNALAELPIVAWKGASVTELRCDTSLHNHMVVE